MIMTMTAPLYVCMVLFWFPFIHTVRDHKSQVKFDFNLLDSPFWSYAHVSSSWNQGHLCSIDTFFHFLCIK